MADYFGVCTREVTNPDYIGVGTAMTPGGAFRLCISLEGEPINEHLGPDWDAKVRWVAVCPEGAKSLLDALLIGGNNFVSRPSLSPEQAATIYQAAKALVDVEPCLAHYLLFLSGGKP